MRCRRSGELILFLILIVLGTLRPSVCVLITDDVIINGLPHRITRKSIMINNVAVEYFAKIPYAKPPIGNLRFKHPQEIEGASWTGVYNSTEQPNTCWQADGSDFDKQNPAARLWLSKTPMSEDCLYLSMWVPQISNTKLPVMVWIYGGSFLSGSSTLEVYDGSTLASLHGVVVVSLQYRLGPLGFMYINEESAPGNQGLMDQRMALMWVKMNIKNFKGDDNQITIFGESAGSASVSFHVLSPLSQNYFNRAIMESGTALAPWAIETKEESKLKAIELAKYVNCGPTLGDDIILLKCLKSMDPATLANLQFNLKDYVARRRLELFRRRAITEFITDGAYIIDLYFKPIYDNYFIPTDNIPSLLSAQAGRKNIDLMMGFNANEGMYFLLYGLHKYLKFIDKGDIVSTDRLSSNNPNRLQPSKIIIEKLLNPRFSYKSLLPLLMYEYRVPSSLLGFKHWTSLQVLSAMDQLVGDELFVCPIISFARTMAENNQNVYLFNFLHRTSAVTFPKWTGTMHGYEVEYVFGMPYSMPFTKMYYPFSREEEQLSNSVMAMWTNFAKFGNPTPTPLSFNGYNASWTAYNLSDPKMFHFSLSKDSPFKINEKTNKCRFWSKVLPSLVVDYSGVGKTSIVVCGSWTIYLLLIVLWLPW